MGYEETLRLIVSSINHSNEATNQKNRQTDKQTNLQATSARRLSSNLNRIQRMADGHTTNSAKSTSKEIFRPRYAPSLLFAAS